MSELTTGPVDPLPAPVHDKEKEKNKKRGRPPKDDREALKRRAMERKHASFEPLPSDSGSGIPSTKDDVRAVVENENANQVKLKQQHLDTIELFENWFPDRIHKKCGLTMDDTVEKMEDQIKAYKSAVSLQTCDERVVLGLTTVANIVEQASTTFDPEHKRIDLTNYSKVTYETMNSEQGRMAVRMAIVSNPFMRLNVNPLLDLGFLMAKTAAEVNMTNKQKQENVRLQGEMKDRKKRAVKPADVPVFRNSAREQVLEERPQPEPRFEELPPPTEDPQQTERTTQE